MAERRMFAKTIIDSDAFLDMPHTTQLLYFHLSMRADDDGFINNPRSIMRNAKCSESDLQMLAVKKFIIPFDSGIVVIKHWKIHNYIAKDRYTETKYKEEKNTLMLDENKAYTKALPVVSTPCIQPVYEADTQVRLGKESIVKESIDNIVHSDPDESERTLKKPSLADVNSFFEALWELYPVKKGKGQVSESKRRTLYAIGFEKLQMAIDRYLKELERDAEWRKPQNGSTFFNSGYVDYLDENFVPDANKPRYGRKEPVPGWCKQTELGNAELEAIQRVLKDDPATAGNDPNIAERAEKLRQQIQRG